MSWVGVRSTGVVQGAILPLVLTMVILVKLFALSTNYMAAVL